VTATGLPSGGEEARSFNQERLAFFTRTLLVILVGFYLAGNLAASAFPSFAIGKWLVANWFANGANPAMLASFTFLAAVGLVLRARARGEDARRRARRDGARHLALAARSSAAVGGDLYLLSCR